MGQSYQLYRAQYSVVCELGKTGKTVGGPLHVPGSETTLIIRGLRPKTRYFFRVKCENTLGESQFGAEVAITTLEERRYRDFCMFLRSRNLRGHLSLFLTE
ncbi:down syndrome cell adhesion molecule [Caerostris darwini]|uniref:Down syndrome cell adhesion molecule n=1 Tax=Caerostris darwini TaxID=1538125 RepID=A0AAV4N1X1_9ARAC|nr:down syndrome cell adhesion molecule [Caerostris darwini]